MTPSVSALNTLQEVLFNDYAEKEAVNYADRYFGIPVKLNNDLLEFED